MKNKYFVICSFFFVFLVSALRNETVGLDTANYTLGFRVLDTRATNVYYSWTANGWEPLWRLLNYSIGRFTDDPQWLLVITSAIIYIGIGVFIYKNCENYESAFWPVFFFMTLAILYPMSMYLLRQFCGLVFIANIHTVLKDNKSKKGIAISVLLLIIGVLFHYSAIIGILILFVEMRAKITKKQLFAAFIISFSAKLVFPLMKYMVIRFIPLYAHYFSTAAYQGEEMRAYSFLMIILRAACCLLILVCIDVEREENRSLVNMCFYSNVALFFTLMLTDTIMAQRLGNYFEFFIILLIPQLLSHFRGRQFLYIAVFAFSWAFFIFELSTGARAIVRKASFNKSLIKRLLLYSAPLIMNDLSWWLIHSSDKIMVEWMLSASALGLYTVASKIPGLINTFVNIFSQAWGVSSIREIESTNDSAFYSSVFNIYSMLSFGAAICFAAVIKPFMNIYVGADFTSAWRYVPPLLLAAAFSAISAYYGSMFGALQKSVECMWSTIIGAVVNVVLNYICIKIWGVWGAIIGTLTAYIVISMLRQYMINRYIKMDINWKKMFIDILIAFMQTIAVSMDWHSYIVSIVAIAAFIINHTKELKTITSMMTRRHDEG